MDERAAVANSLTAELLAALAPLSVHRYRFGLRVVSGTLRLGEFKGSALRGTLLRRLHSLYCVQPFVRRPLACLPCQQAARCPIAFLVDTSADVLAVSGARGDELPRPYAIEPPLDGRLTYEAGALFEFGVTLFGRANLLLPYLVGAVNDFADRLGMGHEGERGLLVLETVWAEQPLSRQRLAVWGAESSAVAGVERGQLAGLQAGMSVAAMMAGLPERAERVTLLFRTPLTLKAGGRVWREPPPFALLLQRLLERVAGLLHVLGDRPLALPFADVLAAAAAVRLLTPADDPLPARWQDVERYSSTHQQRLAIGGLIGHLHYAGELGPLLPWLALGQWLHVGKAAVQGNGSYRLAAVAL